MCGRRKKENRGYCKFPAGFRTQHLGEGPCYLHGGFIPRVVERLALRRMVGHIVQNGKWTEADGKLALDVEQQGKTGTALQRIVSAQTSVPFFQALDAMMIESWDNFQELRQAAHAIPLEERDLRENRMILSRYDAERDRIARIAKDAIAAGVDERRVRIDEAKADKVLAVIQKALEAADLSSDQENQVRAAVADGLREIGSGAAASEPLQGPSSQS